jgi:mitochondrial fission protein ELM1
MRLRRWSRGQSFVVQLQDPRAPLAFFDLVIPPRHDRVAGANVFPITGSPHRATRERMAADLAAFADAIAPLPHPRVAVMVGGASRAFDLPPDRAAAMAHEIGEAVRARGGSLLMSFSRRTPDAAKALLSARLRDLPGLIWDGEGANPYFAFLAASDHILVTEDSTNMAAEAAATGKPVSVLKLDGQSSRIRRFHEDLEARGAARPFGGTFHRWTYPPLRETQRAAQAILDRMRQRADSAAQASNARG